MTTKLFNTLFDEVLSELAGVPQPMAINSIRNAAIDFCERSKAWVIDADPISSVANQAIYEFEPDAGTEVTGVLQAYYNGLEILPKTSAQLESLVSVPGTTFIAGVPWQKQSGVPKYYNIERVDEFILVPYPIEAIALVIVMKIILKPTRTATGMEKWILDKYFMQIAAGAKARLCAMPSKPWSNPTLVSYYSGIFEQGVSAASLNSSWTQRLPPMNTEPSPI